MAKQPKSQSAPPADEQPDKRQMLLEGQELEEDATPAAAADETPPDPGASATTGDDVPETPETPESESPAAAGSSFLDSVRELGYQGEDESEAAQTLLESYRQILSEQQANQRRVQELEELAQYGTEFLRTQREEASTEPEPAAEPGKEPWWNPPKFDPRWIEQYRDVSVGQDGQPVLGWKKNTPREVQQAAEGYQQYLEQWATDLVQRPQEVLPKIIEQEFDRLFEQRIQARDEAQQLSTFAEQVRETNRDWMYTTDSQGRERLTEEGEVMTRLLSEVAQSGVNNPQLQWRYAVAMYDYLNRANQAAVAEQTTAVKQTAAQKRRQQLARGTQPTQNRTGSVPLPEEEPTRPQNPHLTPGQQLLQQLRQDGADFV